MHVLSSILPLISFIPLSLDLLNQHNFAPESKSEDLHAGILQVPQGSTILISDSDMKEGQLSEKGKRYTNLGSVAL